MTPRELITRIEHLAAYCRKLERDDGRTWGAFGRILESAARKMERTVNSSLKG